MSEKSSAKEELLKLASGGAVLLVLWLGASCSSSKKPKKEVATASSEESTPAKPKKIFIDLGDEVIIPAETPMARSAESYDQYIDAKIAKDSQGIRELLIAGQIRMNESPTKARFIGGTFFYRKLRILEGLYENEVWWCDRSLELAKPISTDSPKTQSEMASNKEAVGAVRPAKLNKETKESIPIKVGNRVRIQHHGRLTFGIDSPDDIPNIDSRDAASDESLGLDVLKAGGYAAVRPGTIGTVVGVRGKDKMFQVRVTESPNGTTADIGRVAWYFPTQLEQLETAK